MEIQNKPDGNEFHAVEFMREVRAEMTELFLKDQQVYFDYLKQAKDDFKRRQKQAAHS